MDYMTHYLFCIADIPHADTYRNEIPSGATSLPKVFIGGKCIGGCAELSDLVSSGELEGLLKKAKALKSKK
jgi:glutaredoxin-related protein